MRILIVEDDPAARQLLIYLLEDKFKEEAKFREASSLESAFKYLKVGGTDCIILDLNLPDSSDAETFERLHDAYPTIPILVMTNNRDRELAVKMVRMGASDYILKDFTNEEEVFRRIVFAVERGKRSIAIDPSRVETFNKMDQARAQMLGAHQSGEHVVSDHNIETTAAIAEVIKQVFASTQTISIKLERFTTNLEHVAEDVKELKDDIRGKDGRHSMRSCLNLLDEQVNQVSSRLDNIENNKKEAKFQEDKIITTKMSNKTKLVVALLGLLGAILTAFTTYYTAKIIRLN